MTSGETGQPVGGATLTVAGKSYGSDGAGQISLTQLVAPGSLIDIVAPRFLDRQTLVRSGSDSPFALWPRTSPSGLDENFTREVVYADRPNGLIRLGESVAAVSLVPDASIQADAAAMGALRSAAERITLALGARVRFVVLTAGDNGVVFRLLLVNGATSASAATFRESDGGSRISGGRIEYYSPAAARAANVHLHEIGHAFGLSHSQSINDAMYPNAPLFDFSSREKLAMNLMLQRRPGNQFPDNDRSVRSAAGTTLSVVYCPLD